MYLDTSYFVRAYVLNGAEYKDAPRKMSVSFTPAAQLSQEPYLKSLWGEDMANKISLFQEKTSPALLQIFSYAWHSWNQVTAVIWLLKCI